MDSVDYVGISNNPNRRWQEHLKDKNKNFTEKTHEMIVISTNISKFEARIMEQALIMGFTLNKLANIINSISIFKFNKLKEELNSTYILISSSWDGE